MEKVETKFNFDCSKKLESCLHCTHMRTHLYLCDEADDFAFDIRCDLKCPDKVNFDCMQCLLCDHFEQCCRDDYLV